MQEVVIHERSYKGQFPKKKDQYKEWIYDADNSKRIGLRWHSGNI